jgi:hypothetical protein
LEYGFLTPKMEAKSDCSIFLLSCVIRQSELKHITEILQVHNYAAPGLLPLPHIQATYLFRFSGVLDIPGIEQV